MGRTPVTTKRIVKRIAELLVEKQAIINNIDVIIEKAKNDGIEHQIRVGAIINTINELRDLLPKKGNEK